MGQTLPPAPHHGVNGDRTRAGAAVRSAAGSLGIPGPGTQSPRPPKLKSQARHPDLQMPGSYTFLPLLGCMIGIPHFTGAKPHSILLSQSTSSPKPMNYLQPASCSGQNPGQQPGLLSFPCPMHVGSTFKTHQTPSNHTMQPHLPPESVPCTAARTIKQMCPFSAPNPLTVSHSLKSEGQGLQGPIPYAHALIIA